MISSGLKNLLEQKKAFKLICGAGNIDADEVERLVSIYSQAGCKFFDVSANKEVIEAARRGMAEREGYLCVSVGVKGDPHGDNFGDLVDVIDLPIDCLELHASVEDAITDKWQWMNDNFDGFLSLCISRGKLSDVGLIKRVREVCAVREPYTTIIQADGFPMSGGKDDYKTTLQAVATAEIVQNANLPAYLLLSGGTNSKTAELARLCGIDFNGIGIGSFARKIIQDCPEEQEVAAIAKKLII